MDSKYISNIGGYIQKKDPNADTSILDDKLFTYDDEKAYALLSRGETEGVAEVENPTARKQLRHFKPRTFTELLIAIGFMGFGQDLKERKKCSKAIIRIKSGKEPVKKVFAPIGRIEVDPKIRTVC